MHDAGLMMKEEGRSCAGQMGHWTKMEKWHDTLRWENSLCYVGMKRLRDFEMAFYWLNGKDLNKWVKLPKPRKIEIWFIWRRLSADIYWPGTKNHSNNSIMTISLGLSNSACQAKNCSIMYKLVLCLPLCTQSWGRGGFRRRRMPSI